MRKYTILLLMSLFFTYCSIPSPSDSVPPTIAVVYPYEGAVISADISVEVLAYDNDDIEKVWFYVDGQKIDESTESPYEMSFSISGYDKKVDHLIMAAAEDKEGNIAYSEPVTFIIADTDDIIPPVVEIVNPVTGQVVEGIVNITAYAEDERSVQQVDFFINGEEVGSSSTYPYVYNWNTSGISDSTSHTIFAKAIDGGNNETISTVIQVTVYPRSGAEGDNTAPTALFLYPIADAILTGTVEVSVDLYDNQNVASAEFYVDGQLVETSSDDPESPWTFNWDSSSKADSQEHSLYVKVYDTSGNLGTSGLLTVTVQ